ncbi:MAG: HD domain-containing protein [Clostridia bacterium]|nr:HD domain-containing protein [Clostridia bacterium]
MDVFLKQVINLYELLNTGTSVNETLAYVFDTFRSHIPYDRIGIALLDTNGNIYSQAVCSDYPLVLKEGYSLNLSETSLNNLVSSKECRIVNNYIEYLKSNPSSKPTELLVQEGISSSLACPLISNNFAFGAILFSSKQPDVYSDTHEIIAKTIANNMAISIEKNLLVDNLILASITGFARLIEAKGSDTGMHLERMQNYSKTIAQSLASNEKYKDIINNQYIDDIFKFSPLHDIGKVGIADGILLKPAKLTIEEFEVMKKHTVIGAEVLRKASNHLLRNGRNFFDIAIQIAEGHHEKYNGKGYPYGLSGSNIPLAARIVAVADVFDALTSKRVYKSAFDIEASLQMIDKESGESFDPDIVAALNESIEQIVKIYKRYQENIDLDRR